MIILYNKTIQEKYSIKLLGACKEKLLLHYVFQRQPHRLCKIKGTEKASKGPLKTQIVQGKIVTLAFLLIKTF